MYMCYVITDYRGIDEGMVLETCESKREAKRALYAWAQDYPGARAFACYVEADMCTRTEEITHEIERKRS